MGSGRSQLTARIDCRYGRESVWAVGCMAGQRQRRAKKRRRVSALWLRSVTEQRRLVVQTSAVGVTPAVTPRAAVRLDGVRGLRFDRVLEEEEEYDRVANGGRHHASAFVPLFSDVPSGHDSVLYDSGLDESLDDDDVK